MPKLATFKKIKFFFPTLNHLLFKKIQPFDIFEIFQTLKPCEKLSSKKLLGTAFEKSIKYFLEKTHIIFQEAPTFEFFHSEARRPFETLSIEFCQEGRLLSNRRFSLKNTNLHSPKISISWTFSDFLSSLTTWSASWKEDATFTNFEKTESFFEKKPSFFIRNSKFWTF